MNPLFSPPMNFFVTMISRLRESFRRLTNLGLVSWLNYLRHRLAERCLPRPNDWQQRPDYLLRSPAVKGPLYLRPFTSDLHVYRQVIAAREYRPLERLDRSHAGLILDCGANVGMSGAYLLSTFPNAQLLAVEPDSTNCQQLKKNLELFKDRYRLVQAGVWSENGPLRFEESSYRDGQHWSIQVRRAKDGETADLQGVTVSELLAMSGAERVWILKMDIERAELEVFSKNVEDWLPKVDHIAIELHDATCEEVFFRAVDRDRFDVCRSGDLTFCFSRQS